MSDSIDAALRRVQEGQPKGEKVPGLKFEMRTKSGLPVVVLCPINLTDGDLLEVIADLCRELPAALAQQRGPRLVRAAVLPTKN